MADALKSRPLPVRLWAWMDERFPPSHGVLFAVMYFTAALVGKEQAAVSAGLKGRLVFSWEDALGFLGAWSFFLMLRVFDEHKDYELDLQNHPDRVLQSGAVTLGHLKVLGALAIAAQLGTSLLADGGLGSVTFTWLPVILWSLLMAKEFFVGEWLEERLVLYALSHMIVMPMAIVWMANLGGEPGALPIGLALLAFFSGAAFEVTRKTKAPEDERDTIRTYSQVWGVRGAPLVVVGLLVAQVVVLIGELRLVFDARPPIGWHLALAVAYGLPIAALLGFRKEPGAKAAKLNEGLVSLSMLVGYLVLCAAVLTRWDLQWS